MLKEGKDEFGGPFFKINVVGGHQRTFFIFVSEVGHP